MANTLTLSALLLLASSTEVAWSKIQHRYELGLPVEKKNYGLRGNEDADPEDAETADGVVDDRDESAIIRCGSSTGDFAMRLERSWSPRGYDRAVELFERGFYDHTHFFRVVSGYLAQFGISYSTDRDLMALSHRPIRDDPPLSTPIPFDRGIISFAGSGPNSRTSQLFIAYERQPALGKEVWETPIGKVIEGMDFAVEFFYGGFGDMPPWGKGPVQGRIHTDGYRYIEREFPMLDHFHTCLVERIQDKAAHGRKKVKHRAKKQAHRQGANSQPFANQRNLEAFEKIEGEEAASFKEVGEEHDSGEQGGDATLQLGYFTTHAQPIDQTESTILLSAVAILLLCLLGMIYYFLTMESRGKRRHQKAK